jgi:hypothetical protein
MCLWESVVNVLSFIFCHKGLRAFVFLVHMSYVSWSNHTIISSIFSFFLSFSNSRYEFCFTSVSVTMFCGVLVSLQVPLLIYLYQSITLSVRFLYHSAYYSIALTHTVPLLLYSIPTFPL